MTVSTSASWRAIATTPRAPLSATVARLIFEHAVAKVPVRVTYPDGRVLGGGPPAAPELQVVRPAAFFARLGRDAKIGFGYVMNKMGPYIIVDPRTRTLIEAVYASL